MVHDIGELVATIVPITRPFSDSEMVSPTVALKVNTGWESNTRPPLPTLPDTSSARPRTTGAAGETVAVWLTSTMS
jgi:hypothetical protein